jgi:hypothetical protein
MTAWTMEGLSEMEGPDKELLAGVVDALVDGET